MAEAIKQSGQLITAQNQLSVIKEWSEKFDQLTMIQNGKLSEVERQFGVSIITNLVGRCVQAGISANELDLTNFLEQVKHFSKQQLSVAEKELYLDIRNNSKTGLKTVTISRQYQGIQKLMMQYCAKKVVRFMDGIVCEGDDFSVKTDFDSGMERIVSHVKSPSYDKNAWDKVKYAYAIAYVEEYGKLVPYTCIIDKQRISRGRKAAQTDNVWRSDLAMMITKTAYWCLWAQMRPYMHLPVDVMESIAATEDKMDFNNTEPAKEYTDVVISDHIGDTNDLPESYGTEEPERAQEETPKTQKRIPYVEYTNNKDKYEKVESSYDKSTKTIAVYCKD